MQRLLLHLAAFSIAAPCFAIEIEWHVEHPYRHYRYHSDLTLHEWAYRELRAQAPMAAIHAPISHMERKLNNPSWWDEGRLSAVAALRATEGRQPERPTPTMIRHGWASLLRSTPAGSTIIVGSGGSLADSRTITAISAATASTPIHGCFTAGRVTGCARSICC